jgi:hypothetical protein
MSEDKIDAQGSQGLVYKPQGTVEQHFGDRTEANTGLIRRINPEELRDRSLR